MIEERYEDLLHRALDGELTPEESARLRGHLAASPEARAHYDDLENLFQMLAQVEEFEPPAAFREAIVERIRATPAGAGPAARHREGWLGPAVMALRKGLRPATAYAFAAGIVAGLALLATFGQHWTPGSVDDSALPGTMLRSRQLKHLAAVDEQQLTLDGARGRIRTKFVSGTVVAEIDLSSPGALEVVIEFDGGVLSPVAFEQTRAGAGRITVGSGRIHIDHSGQRTYLLVFTGNEGAVADGGAASNLVVRLLAGDRSVEKVLRTSPKDG